jgi:hypothetical protein
MRPLRPADAEAFAALVRSAFVDWAVDPLPSALRVTADDIGRHFGDGGGGVTTDPAQAGLLWAEKEGGLYISGSPCTPPTAARAWPHACCPQPRPKHGAGDCLACGCPRGLRWPATAPCFAVAASSRAPRTFTPDSPNQHILI